ncbi:MAG: GNAT family N-acetyltransferase [Planctomycetaceae bacterium]|nr:GNAT family N-acetyltransferase [Planctomycetaceae bacterium]
MMIIRRLTAADAGEFLKLRREALQDAPLAFGSSPDDDRFIDIDAARRDLVGGAESCVFGAFSPVLVGTIGLDRDPKIKSAHKGHLWGMYVTPASRRQGVAAALLQAAVQHAQTLPGMTHLHLCATSAAGTALQLYKRAGFVVWGTEPDALMHDGRTVDEHYLVKRLDPLSRPLQEAAEYRRTNAPADS